MECRTPTRQQGYFLRWRSAAKACKIAVVSEIIFVVEEAPESGYTARALGVPIFTEADSIEQLHIQVRDAVACHYDEPTRPKVIRLHFVRDEVIAAG